MQSIELYQKLNDPIAAIDQMGEWFAKSGMFGCDRAEQGNMLALACMTENMSPFEVKRRYHLMNGELVRKADSLLADFRSKGGKHVVVARTDQEAAVKLTYDGQTMDFNVKFADLQGEPFIYRKDGKTLKDTWANPWTRRKMLWARVISDGVNTLAPEISAGMITPEEAEDTAPVVTAKPLLEPAKPAAPPEPPKPTVGTVTKATEADKRPANIIDLPAAKAEPAPEAPKAEPAKAPGGIFQAEAQPNGKLTVATCIALANAVGAELQDKMLDWLKGRKWIKETLLDLSLDRAQRILNKPEEFKAVISKK